MATPTNVTEATAALNSVSDLMNGLLPTLDQRINTATQAVGNTQRSFFVDQASGDDAADGSVGAPFQSLDEAVRRSVQEGSTIVTLLSDYQITGRLSMRGGKFQIKGQTGSETLSFADNVTGFTEGSGTKISPHIWMSLNGSHLRISDLNLRLGSYGATNDIDVAINMAWFGQVLLEDVDFVGVAASDQSVFLKGTGSAVAALNYTSDASMAGRWIHGIAGGTDPATVSNLLFTNLGSL